MSRKVRIAVVQSSDGPGAVQRGLGLLEEAGRQGVDIALLPECFNMADFTLAEWPANAALPGAEVEVLACAIAAHYHFYVVLPLMRKVDGRHRNQALIIDRTGQVIGVYTKTHMARAIDAELMHALPGEGLPVFDLDFGRIGVMICYDNYFPGVAATLAAQRAEIIFYPHLQAGPSELVWETQTRARAVDHCLYVVTCCPGVPREAFWRPGMLFGRSAVIGPDGLALCDAGRYEGFAVAEIDLDWPYNMDITHTGDVRDLRRLIREDTRPDLYHF